MISIKVFHATNARNNLFKLLKMVEEGEDVLIIKKDSNRKFKVSLIEEEEKSSKSTILKQMAQANFKSRSPEEIKRIIENTAGT